MADFSVFSDINPFVRMMRLKKEADLSGKWRDIDNVYTYIASGNADFIVGGKRIGMHTGSAIILPPFMTHVIVSHGTEPLIQYIMHFDFYEDPERRGLVHKDVLDEEEKNLRVSERENLLGGQALLAEIPERDRTVVSSTWLGMMTEFDEDRPGRELFLKAGCMELLVLTLRNGVDVVRSGGKERRTKAWVHIENAVELILGSDLCGDLSNDTIAAAVGVSANYLTSIFQEYLGISLHKYIMHVRIERAQQLLLSGKVNVTEAANLTGFSSVHAFSKSFKEMLGMSPSRFLNETVTRENLAGGAYVD